jgi:hypothetical protein
MSDITKVREEIVLANRRREEVRLPLLSTAHEFRNLYDAERGAEFSELEFFFARLRLANGDVGKRHCVGLDPFWKVLVPTPIPTAFAD